VTTIGVIGTQGGGAAKSNVTCSRSKQPAESANGERSHESSADDLDVLLRPRQRNHGRGQFPVLVVDAAE